MEDIDISSLGLTDAQVRILNTAFTHQDVTYITSQFLHEVLKCDKQAAKVIIWVIAGLGMLTPVILREGYEKEGQLALWRKASHIPRFTNGKGSVGWDNTPEAWVSIQLYARFLHPRPQYATPLFVEVLT